MLGGTVPGATVVVVEDVVIVGVVVTVLVTGMVASGSGVSGAAVVVVDTGAEAGEHDVSARTTKKGAIVRRIEKS